MPSNDARRIYCRFRYQDRDSYGLIEDGRVFELDAAPFGPHERTSNEYDLSEVTLLVPTMPRAFVCAGRNYTGHAGQAPLPTSPQIGDRATSALIAHDEDIIKPRDSGEKLQYEGELVAVIGKAGKHISKETALDHVFGWTIGNDVTERSWLSTDLTMWRSKNSDTFKPMGPWIVTGVDPEEMVTTVRVNGKTTEQFRTADMLFDVATYISEITKVITLMPGDVLWMGTNGVSPDLTVGDVVEVEISGIGTLRNTVVADSDDLSYLGGE